MNINRLLKAAFVALLGLALAVSTGKAQTFLTNDIINTFDTGGNTNQFFGTGSVASWIYWYNSPGNNQPMTNDPTMDAGGNPNSGSLMVVSPLAGGTQNQFFGTFGNGGGYDLRSQEANLLNYTSVSFDIRFASNTVLSSSGNLGSIAVLAISQSGPPSYSVTTTTLTNGMVIPAQAETNWVHMVVPIDHTLAGLTAVGGIGFNYNSYGGYPLFTTTNWIDNLVVHSGAPPPPPPTLTPPTRALSGLNCIATIGGAAGQYNRYHLCTVNDTGYTFAGQSSVTYSWTVKQFPQKTGTSFQQHVFLVNGAPGPFDQAADYNLADCIFLTVQQNDAGVAFFNFRYKTNEPGGNGMLFNGTDTANGITYPVAGAPSQPACSLTDSNGAVGTWSITFAQTTNVTITGPGGVTTNFVFDPAAAALFADPMSICVGGQPNNTTGGQVLVYGSFSATGCATPINDNFSADTSLDTNTWKNLSNDTNGCVLAPAGTSWMLGWSLPDTGFSLQTTGALKTKSNTWSSLSSLGTIQDNGKRVVLVNTSNLLNTNMSFFSLIQRVFTKLQVLLPGETAAPGTATGKTGTPDPEPAGNTFNVIVNAVDANWFPISGVTDTIALTSTDPQFLPPLPAQLVNGTVTLQVQMGSSGSWTITATDSTDNTKTANTSSTIVVP